MPHTEFKLAAFRRWAREATYGSVFVYHREPLEREEALLEYARKLSDDGLAFLYSRRLDDGSFEKCAKRTNPRDLTAIDRFSKSITVERAV